MQARSCGRLLWRTRRVRLSIFACDDVGVCFYHHFKIDGYVGQLWLLKLERFRAGEAGVLSVGSRQKTDPLNGLPIVSAGLLAVLLVASTKRNLPPIGECIDSLLQRLDSFEFHVLLVPYLKQESFYSGETPCNWLDDGGDNGPNFSTTLRSRFAHSGQSPRPIGV